MHRRDVIKIGEFPVQLGPAMSWPEAVEKAKVWVESSGDSFAVAGLQEESRRIDFASSRGSFYVILPEKPGGEWVCICSESSASCSRSLLVPCADGVE